MNFKLILEPFRNQAYPEFQFPNVRPLYQMNRYVLDLQIFLQAQEIRIESSCTVK